MELLADYGLFLAKSVTVLVAILVVIAVAAGIGQRQRRGEGGHIEVTSLNDTLDTITSTLRAALVSPDVYKQEMKAKKKADKVQAKQRKKDPQADTKPRVFVLDFDGDIAASAVKTLREEVTAILSVANAEDEVVIRLESPGGQVHGYGLAASQLSRIVSRGISLTVAVDKVAASGGYMMACIGSKIIAAPFALLGSIGVVAQVPNFHRFLKNRDVDVEVLTAGEYKRTLTLFGENTERGREKFQEELDDVHTLFKEFVAENRPVVDADAVSTGEAWYGTRALEKCLVDELKTSDEYLGDRCGEASVYLVKYVEDKHRFERLLDRFSSLARSLTNRDDWQSNRPHYF